MITTFKKCDKQFFFHEQEFTVPASISLHVFEA